MSIEDVIFDSEILQFVGSEQYLEKVPLFSTESYYVNPTKSIFDAKQIRKFKKLAKQLNRTGEGDEATFCLKKIRTA